MYTQVRREAMGIGWLTDYPYAAVNLMTRASELTKIPVSWDANHNPHPWVVRLTDAALFDCPVIVASDVGTMGISDAEAARLREYLLKGGFLWVDDFWGTNAWEQWVSQIRKVFDAGEYPIVDLPPTHPIFRTYAPMERVPQITNIQFWRGSGGTETSERGADSVDVHTRAINDAHGRIMVLMTHNTDLGDSWEREGEDPGYFYQFSPPGYAVGLNVLRVPAHALSHRSAREESGARPSRFAAAGETNQTVGEIGDGSGFAVMERDVARGLAQPLPQSGVGEQALDFADDGLRVPGRDDEGALAVGQRVGRDAHARRHNRQSRRHRLDERHAEPFVQTRRDHDVGLSIEIDERRAARGAG